MAVLTGVDFFTVEVLTWRGLATYYVLFFLQLETRRVTLADITRQPTVEWMLQMSRNATDEEIGPSFPEPPQAGFWPVDIDIAFQTSIA